MRGDEIHALGAIRAREMLRVLHERGLLDPRQADVVTQHALALLCLSAFYGAMPFTRVVRLLAVVWATWEDNRVSPDPAPPSPSSEDAEYELLLREWTPPKGGKVS